MTNSKCTLLMIVGLLMAGCSAESTPPRILSDAEMFNGTIHIKAFNIGASNSTYSGADLTITNYMDYGVSAIVCDTYGYQDDVLVASGSNQRMFPPPRITAIPDIEPGQSRSAFFMMKSDSDSANPDRIEWTCTHGRSDTTKWFMFEGSS